MVNNNYQLQEKYGKQKLILTASMLLSLSMSLTASFAVPVMFKDKLNQRSNLINLAAVVGSIGCSIFVLSFCGKLEDISNKLTTLKNLENAQTKRLWAIEHQLYLDSLQVEYLGNPEDNYQGEDYPQIIDTPGHTQTQLDTDTPPENLSIVEVLDTDTSINTRAHTCPECDSTNIKSNGLTDSGKPRLRCKDCGKSWTNLQVLGD